MQHRTSSPTTSGFRFDQIPQTGTHDNWMPGFPPCSDSSVLRPDGTFGQSSTTCSEKRARSRNSRAVGVILLGISHIAMVSPVRPSTVRRQIRDLLADPADLPPLPDVTTAAEELVERARRVLGRELSVERKTRTSAVRKILRFGCRGLARWQLLQTHSPPRYKRFSQPTWPSRNGILN